MRTHLFGAGDPGAQMRRRALQEKIQRRRELDEKLAAAEAKRVEKAADTD